MTRSLNVRRRHRYAVITLKPKYGNDNKRIRTSYYFVEANYWPTQSIARPLCNSRATCKSFSLSPNITSHYRRNYWQRPERSIQLRDVIWSSVVALLILLSDDISDPCALQYNFTDCAKPTAAGFGIHRFLGPGSTGRQYSRMWTAATTAAAAVAAAA